MGKFDGILIASDWDGTFYSNKLFEENIRALEYFVANGGKFTVCSGRYRTFLKSFSDRVPMNTYTICYNGAYIVDLRTDEVLFEGFCDERLFDIIKKIIDNDLPYETVNIYDDSSDEPISYTFNEYLASVDEIRKKNIYKVLFRASSVEKGTEGAKLANRLNLYDYIAVRSWGLSLEIMKKAHSKGCAAKRVKEKIGARLLVGVGDYENDIELIKNADIGYAVDNAIDEVKAVAHRHTVSVYDSAIAKIIYDLEKEIDNGTLYK